MRMKDLSVGMEVALVASTYYDTGVPKRWVVVSLDHTDTRGPFSWSRDLEGMNIALPANVTNDGVKHVVKAPIRPYREGERRDAVTLARVKDDGKVEVKAVLARKVEGPFAEVRDARADLEARRREARATAAARAAETRARRQFITADLRKVLGDRFTGGYRDDSITLSLEEAAMLLRATRGESQ